MKRTKLLKYLHQHGCRWVHEGGDHTIYANADGTRQTSIPRHAEVLPRTIRKICKDVDIPPPLEK